MFISICFEQIKKKRSWNTENEREIGEYCMKENKRMKEKCE